MKPNLLIVILALFGFSAQAQITNIWQGGHPSHESDWNAATNWSLGEVPNHTHDVVIPNSSIFPVLTGKTVELNSLQMQSGAELTLKNGARIALPTSVLFAQATIYWDNQTRSFQRRSRLCKAVKYLFPCSQRVPH